MLQDAYSEALAMAGDEVEVEVAGTRDQVLEAQRLRHRVYCEERGFLVGANGIEEDEFDVNSVHVLVRGRSSGVVYGTVRVVLSGVDGIGFPMHRVCGAHVFKSLCLRRTGEVSRFAVTRDRSGISPAASGLVRLFLIRGIVRVSGERGLTHWCATMERTLLRLLRTTAIHFEPLGVPIDYHGIRQPASWSLAVGLARVRREHPSVWAFLTAEGTLWTEPATSDGQAVPFPSSDGQLSYFLREPALC